MRWGVQSTAQSSWRRRALRSRAPLLHALRPVVGLQAGHQHLLRPQARAQSFDQLVQAIALSLIFRQQAQAFTRQGLGLQTAQAQMQNRRGQIDSLQLLSHEPLQVLHVLRGLGRAQLQLARMAKSAAAVVGIYVQ